MLSNLPDDITDAMLDSHLDGEPSYCVICDEPTEYKCSNSNCRKPLCSPCSDEKDQCNICDDDDYDEDLSPVLEIHIV